MKLYTMRHHMKKLCIIVLGISMSVSVLSQVVTPNWTIRTDNSSEATAYRHEAIGLSTRDSITRRARSAFSLICTKSSGTAKIVIQWENMQGYGNRNVNYRIDKREITPNGKSFVMKQEGEILYRSIDSSRELLQAMKTGSILTIDWVGFDQTRYLTTFNLSTFRSNLSEFNKRCGTDI